MKFAPSSTAIRRAIFLISFSEKPTVRSAFRSWQMPKKSMFGFIAFLLYTKREPYSIAGYGSRGFWHLCFWLYSSLLPKPMGDFKQRRLAAAPRVLHPSEDLSELPPLRSVVAGQVYHYRLAGSSQNSLPKLLPAGWVRSSPYWAVFIQQSCTGGLRASAKSLSLVGFCQLMYCWIGYSFFKEQQR